MVEPPDNHKDLPHNVSKHYFIQYAEMMGYDFKHDDYSVMANWILTYLSVNQTTIEQ